MNEGFLGKFSFGGERAATDDHPVVLHYLPLASTVVTKLEPGTLLKGTDVPGATVTIGESLQWSPGSLPGYTHASQSAC